SRQLCTSVFFFQAEDGIRDGHVTGVQTCALPISFQCGFNAAELILNAQFSPSHLLLLLRNSRGLGRNTLGGVSASPNSEHRRQRSEERRVGKECRDRCARDYE